MSPTNGFPRNEPLLHILHVKQGESRKTCTGPMLRTVRVDSYVSSTVYTLGSDIPKFGYLVHDCPAHHLRHLLTLYLFTSLRASEISSAENFAGTKGTAPVTVLDETSWPRRRRQAA
jgi:hypothetical protein